MGALAKIVRTATDVREDYDVKVHLAFESPISPRVLLTFSSLTQP